MGDVNSHHSVRPSELGTFPVEEEDAEMADDKEEEDTTKTQEGKVKDEEGQEKDEEARIVKGKKAVRQPNQEEYDSHMRSHIPFRKWCPHCVKGKRKNDPHRTPKEKEEREIPTMSWDYMRQRGKD